jgi:alkanesulfonate monooxygenase SsuD/methylene tetrahydromethanopterin reductase-like flavin-dependent oxidoreductase (luciferase family)
MSLRFGVFDHIEPVPGLRLDQIDRERLIQIERLDAAGFYAYHLVEHHTPAIHSLAPSQSVAQRTRRRRFGPCVYVLPLHHPLRLIEEISMLAILREGLSHDELTFAGRFHSFEHLPMYLRPLQKPYPPLWYMRNPVTAAMEGMHTIIVGSLDLLGAAVARYRAAWEEHQGAGRLTVQGQEPMIGRAVREYMDEYVATGANYFVCSFQWGDLTHEQAMRSVELFAAEVMPSCARAAAPAA